MRPRSLDAGAPLHERPQVEGRHRVADRPPASPSSAPPRPRASSRRASSGERWTFRRRTRWSARWPRASPSTGWPSGSSSTAGSGGGKMFALRYDAIDFVQGCAFVRLTYDRHGLREPKTKSGRRVVPLDDDLLRQLADARAVAEESGEPGFVLPGRANGPPRPRCWTGPGAAPSATRAWSTGASTTCATTPSADGSTRV